MGGLDRGGRILSKLSFLIEKIKEYMIRYEVRTLHPELTALFEFILEYLEVINFIENQIIENSKQYLEWRKRNE